MKKLVLALSTVLFLGNLATPAVAFVIDRQNLVPAAEEKELADALSRLGPHRFEVLFVKQTSGAPSAEAKQTFRRLGLGDKDGVIVVAIQAKKVGVYVGPGFTQRGVSDQVVSQHIKSDFLPYAKQGNFAQGAAVLAKGLIDAGKQAAPSLPREAAPVHSLPISSAPAPAPQPSPQPDDGGGLIALFVLLGVPLVWGLFWLKEETDRKTLQDRFDELRGQQEAIVTHSISLAEIDELARYQQGDVQRAYQKLGQAAQQTLQRARDFNERFTQTDEALKAKKNDSAKKLLEGLEHDALPLVSEVAASMTALSQLEAGGLNGKQALEAASLPERVQTSTRRLRDLLVSFVRESKRARLYGLEPSQQLKRTLEEAHERLTQIPVDPAGAEQRLAELDAGLTYLVREIDVAEERERIRAEQAARIRAAQAQAQAAEAQARAAQAAMLAAATSRSSEHHHHHYNSSSSWSSSGGGSSWSSSAGGGSSADDSWGSSSAGGSSADNSWGSSDGGGSSADDKW